MSKRSAPTNSTTSRQTSLNPFDEDAITLLPDSSHAEEKRPHRAPVFRAQDQTNPEWIVAALAEIREFTQFHFLPLAEHLTADHLESFLQSARKT
jgi:hypothetical protein